MMRPLSRSDSSDMEEGSFSGGGLAEEQEEGDGVTTTREGTLSMRDFRFTRSSHPASSCSVNGNVLLLLYNILKGLSRIFFLNLTRTHSTFPSFSFLLGGFGLLRKTTVQELAVVEVDPFPKSSYSESSAFLSSSSASSS